MSGRRPQHPDPCPDEGAFVALLDGELDPDRALETRRHVDLCPDCENRLDALQRRDRAVRAWIRKHDPPPLPREAYDLGSRHRGRRRVPRWAAAAAVLLVVAAAAGPARGWLVGGIHSLFGDPGEPEDRTTEVVEEASGATTLVPEGREVTLVFTSPRTQGRLVVEPSPDAQLTLREPETRVRITVGPDAVEVGNNAVPSGDYRLAVPVSLHTLRVRVAGVGDTLVDVSELEGPLVLDLPPPGP